MKNLNPLQNSFKKLAMICLMVCTSNVFAQATIDPKLVRELEQNQQAEFFIRLSQQVNTSQFSETGNVLQRRTAMVDALRQTADDSQADIKAFLDQRGVTYRSFWITNAILVEGDLELLRQIQNRADVASIDANPKVVLETAEIQSDSPESAQAVEQSLIVIGAPDIWALGFNGSGTVIGGQDTGYRWDHDALREQYRGWDGVSADHNYNWHDAIHVDNARCEGDSPFPCDDNNHGTHTMGTMVGDDGGENQIGVAPGAKWIGCRNMNLGAGTAASYTECFQWFIAPTDLNGENPDPSKAPHVINNSWGCPPPPDEDCADPNIMLDVVNNVVAAGIVVVVSAGNSGPGCSSVSTPAAIYEASFTVGATNNSDGIASFSSRGPVTVDGSDRAKPEISAPGVGIRSSTRNGGYGNSSGTSMAGPHVAGLVSLMISADPSLAGNVDLIRTRIQDNAVQLTTGQSCGGVPGSSIPNHTFGYGRIDATKSVIAVTPDLDFDHSFESQNP